MEEAIIGFDNDTESSVSITHSNIVCSEDDETGVYIAAESLAADLWQITGVNRTVMKLGRASDEPERLPTAIVAGSLNSSLVQTLVASGAIDVSEIEGKWESFVTTVVDSPLPFVDRALVVVGSDKCGTIFGIYTISEQAGQSP